jgi:erythromycin esterase-like protein
MFKKQAIIILLYFFILENFALAQSENLFNRLTIHPIATLSLKEINYSQIEPFENILSNNDILILSEGGHADGATYDAQCMIIKGLIDRGKINTVYTESSWLNIEKISSILK